MDKKRILMLAIACLLLATLLVSVHFASTPALAGDRSDITAVDVGHTATITISLTDMGLEFGAITDWEASLYAGAVMGEETSGRFTAWVTATGGTVTFTLPDDVNEDAEAPWNVPDDTYVRIRSGSDLYPVFDLVSDPFTLVHADFMVQFAILGMNETMENGTGPLAGHETAVITAHLKDWGGDFGAPGLWEASLYAGAVAGEETSGRFTAWVPVSDPEGDVVFNLPDDVLEGSEAPWGEAAYVRIRHVGADVYPTFDLVGQPFILLDGSNVHTSIIWQRDVVQQYVIFLPLIMR
jgi:hypothetical protein